MTGRDKSASRRPPEPTNRCADLAEKTALASPKAAAKKLKLNDVLNVVLQSSRDGRSTVVAAKEGEVVGSIASARSPQLIRCLEQGYLYEAVVLEVSGGHIGVEVHAKS